jgi:hypothetical protein
LLSLNNVATHFKGWVGRQREKERGRKEEKEREITYLILDYKIQTIPNPTLSLCDWNIRDASILDRCCYFIN